MGKHAWLNKRVVLVGGVLDGELATVVPDDEGYWYWEEDGKVTAHIRFDRHNAVLGADKGNAVLRECWEYVEDLRVIE